MRIKIVLLFLFAMSLLTTPVYPSSDDGKSLVLPNGQQLTLKGTENVYGPNMVVLDGKQIYKSDQDLMYLEKAFPLSNGTAVLISERCGGNLCGSNYRFLTLTLDNKVKVSNPFFNSPFEGGSVSKSEQKYDTITLVLEINNIKKIYKQFTYKNGQISSKLIDHWTGKSGKVLPVSEIFKMAGKYPYEILANLDVKATIMSTLKINEKTYSDLIDTTTAAGGAKISNSILIMEGFCG